MFAACLIYYPKDSRPCKCPDCFFFFQQSLPRFYKCLGPYIFHGGRIIDLTLSQIFAWRGPYASFSFITAMKIFSWGPPSLLKTNWIIVGADVCVCGFEVHSPVRMCPCVRSWLSRRVWSWSILCHMHLSGSVGTMDSLDTSSCGWMLYCIKAFSERKGHTDYVF